MEIQKEILNRQVRILFFTFFLYTIKTLFHFLTRTRFALIIYFISLRRLCLLLSLGICLFFLQAFHFLTMIMFTFTIRSRFNYFLYYL
jgi:hypothetical protein